MAKNIKLSVAIPVHNMQGGEDFLRQSLRMLSLQTFKDFEVVISDNSDDDRLIKVCREFDLNIKYFKNPIKGMAPNTNEAMEQCTGELIKILYQDDYLADVTSLQEIVTAFDPNDRWLVAGCAHTTDGIEWQRPHYPRYNNEMIKGENTIGSPSVLTVRNDGHLKFDDTMTWLLDADLYRRYYDKHGEPKILRSINVIIRQGSHQMTNILTNEQKLAEHNYMDEKYG